MKQKQKNNRKIIAIFSVIILILSLLIFTPNTASYVADAETETEGSYPSDRVEKLAYTIAHIETGGTFDCSLVGASQEVGCYQYTPSTWEGYSKLAYGEVIEQTPENAEKLTEYMMNVFIEKGYSNEDIFLTWNQGNRGACSSGYNRAGTFFDSCAYVEKALDLYSTL